MSASSSSKQTSRFKAFPEFTKLTLADRNEYESLIAGYPPIADIAYPTLMTWWNVLEAPMVSLLNDGLVLVYWFPGADDHSGYSFVGTRKVDESICMLFDYLRESDRPVRIVHVPEFVIGHMQHPELFTFKEERGSDEYILPVNKFYPLDSIVSYRRHRVRQFLSRVSEDRTEIKSLDLSVEENRSLLLGCAKEWPRKGTINDIVKRADETMEMQLRYADEIGIENVCLYIDGRLHGYILYHLPADEQYAIFSYAMVNYEIPYTLDYLIYAFAHWFLEQGITYINMDADLSHPMLRMIKLSLGPVNYFRKYTITPTE